MRNRVKAGSKTGNKRESGGSRCTTVRGDTNSPVPDATPDSAADGTGRSVAPDSPPDRVACVPSAAGADWLADFQVLTAHLASFPETNPGPVLEVNAKGVVVYANPAAGDALEQLGLGRGEVQAFLPADLQEILGALRRKAAGSFSREIEISGRFFGERIHLAPQFNTVRIYARDITDSKLTADALRLSEERFRLMAETSSDVIFQLGTDGRINYCSPAVRAFGYEQADLINESFENFLLPKDLAKAAEAFYRVAGGENISGFDITILRADGSTAEIELSATPLINDGIVTGIQGIAHDITSRLRTEEQLRRSKERFERLAYSADLLLKAEEPQLAVETLCRELLDYLDCQVFINYIAEGDGKRLRLNSCAGIPDEEARKIAWLDFGAAVCGCVARDASRIVAEHIGTTPDDRTRLVSSFGVRAYACHPLIADGGVVIGTLSFGSRTRDTFSADELDFMEAVSAHVAIAMERVRSRTRLEALVKERTDDLVGASRILESFFTYIPTCLVFLDRQFNFIRVNEAYARVCGRDTTDFEGHNHFEDYPSDELKEQFRQVVETKQLYSISGRPFSFPQHPEWGVTYWDLMVAPILDQSGEVDFLVFTLDNVTARKTAQDRLVRLNRFYALLSGVNEAIIRHRERQALFDEVCQIIVRVGGLRLAWVGLADAGTREVRPVASSGETGYLQGLRIIAADVPEGRGPTGRAIAEGRPVINRDFDEDERMRPWRERAQLHKLRSSCAFPLLCGGQCIGALTFYSDQPGFFSEEEITLLMTLSENLSYAIGAIESEKKRREGQVALQQAASEVEDLYNNAPCGYFSLDRRGVIVRINNTALSWFGGTRDQIVARARLADFCTPESLARFEGDFARLMEHGTATDLEYAFVRGDGTEMTGMLSSWAIYDRGGSFLVSRSILYDITERRRTERMTIATNAVLKLFGRTLKRGQYLDELAGMMRQWCACDGVGIRLLGEDGSIPYAAFSGLDRKFWSGESCLSLGKDRCICTRVIGGSPTPGEQMQTTDHGSFLCNDLQGFVDGLKKKEVTLYRLVCSEQGLRSLATVPIRHQSRILGAIHIVDRRRNGLNLTVIGLIEAISPLIGEALYRFYIEEALISSREKLRQLSSHLVSAREEERTRIAREIHDDLGQTLTAVGLELSALRKLTRPTGAAAAKLDLAAVLIDTAVDDIHRICSELRPRVLDHLGLSAAIQWEAAKFTERTGLTCDLDLQQGIRELPGDISIALFRIIQESFTNVARHAKATSVSVRLSAANGDILMEICDNGKGIRQQTGKTSYGILGMQERALQLGGNISIIGKRGKGTTIAVKLPINRGGSHVQNPDR